MDNALSLVTHWWLPFLFAVGAASIGWRFRQTRDGRIVLWSGVGAAILTLILASAIALWPDAVFGLFWS
jgi:hypothetical protein